MPSSRARAHDGERAVIYRMVMPDHVCPFGVMAKDLLERTGFEVEDHHLNTRAETDAFQREHGVRTTPQIFIGHDRVGGYQELREFLGGLSGDVSIRRETPSRGVE